MVYTRKSEKSFRRCEMRKSAIIIILVLIAIFAVIAFFMQDRYLERAFESTLEIIVGAKVEIDNFHLSLLKLECSWDRMQIAKANDPWRNLVETGKANFKIEGRPLFWKRVIIKEMKLENVRGGTKRLTDGSLPKKAEEPEEEEKKSDEPDFQDRAKTSLTKQLEQLPVLNLGALGKEFKIDSLVKLDELYSVQAYEKLNKMADSSYAYWKEQLKPDDYVKEVETMKAEVAAMKLDETRDPIKLAVSLKKLNEMYKRIQTLRQDVTTKYNSSTKAVSDLQKQLKDVQGAVKQDIAKAQQLARLKDIDVKDVGLMLFGKPMMNQFDEIMGYVNTGRKYLPTAKKLLASEKEPKPPRFKGQDIRFPFHYNYPKFLLRQANFSAATATGDTSRAYLISGKLTGYTTEPALYGRPTKLNVETKRSGGNAYDISGTFDHRTEVAHDSLWLSAKNWGLGKKELKSTKNFPTAISANKGNVQLSSFFIGDQIDMKLNLVAAPVTFYFDESTSKIQKIVEDVLSALKQLELNVSLAGKKNDYAMRMNSNIDQVLAKSIKNVLAKNIQEARQKVEKYVQDEIAKRRQKVEAEVDKYKQQLVAKMDDAKKKVQEQYDRVEQKKKDVEARIKEEEDKARKKAEEEKKKLEEEAKKKLNNLLKRP